MKPDHLSEDIWGRLKGLRDEYAPYIKALEKVAELVEVEERSVELLSRIRAGYGQVMLVEDAIRYGVTVNLRLAKQMEDLCDAFLDPARAFNFLLSRPVRNLLSRDEDDVIEELIGADVLEALGADGKGA